MVSARGCPGSTCISPVWLERCKLSLSLSLDTVLQLLSASNACSVTTWTFAPARAPARVPPHVLTHVGFLDRWAYIILPSCSCPLVLAVRVFSCGFDWGATLCQLCLVNGQGSLGTKVSAYIVLRMLLGMSDTWFLIAQICSRFGSYIQACSDPLLLLCNNSCGKGTSSGSPTSCWIALEHYIVWVVAKRICLTKQCH